MLKSILSALFTVICTLLSISQTQQSGNLKQKIYDKIDALPGEGNNDYTAPTSVQFSDWKSMVQHLIDQNYALATTEADLLGYDLIEFVDNADTYMVLEEKTTSSNHWGTYIYNPSYCREITIQSPHPKKDFNTGKQGVYVFKESNCFFYCLTGTNRCNHTSTSGCSGTTSVCDATSSPFRISDVAHNDSSIFQSTTEAIADFINPMYFIQLHGFSKQSTDPYVILSNGTQITPTPDYIDLLADALYAADTVLDFKIAHQDLTWTRLRGFTNTQGRYINGSSNACDQNADTTQGYFIHIEQEKIRLRNDSTAWNKMVSAVNASFLCSNLNVDKIDQRSFNIFPVPAKETIFIDQLSELGKTLIIYDINGVILKELDISQGKKKLELDISHFQRGTYLIKIGTQYGKFIKY